MQGHAFVKPALQADGTPFLIRRPERGWQPLAAEGDFVPLDDYWCRRIRDADVIEAAPPPAEGSAPVKPKHKAKA